MTVQVQLVVARLDEELSQIRTRIVDQANTYLQRIRSRSGHRARGYHAANQAYADAQNQGKAVRIHAQIYNACRGMLERLKWNKEPSAARNRLLTWSSALPMSSQKLQILYA